jgi:hypothetical protein
MRRLLFALCLLAPVPAMASPCTAQRLTGMWSLVSIRSADPSVEAFYARAPHEVMRFGAGGDFIYVASAQRYTAESARSSLDQADAVDGVSYGFQVEDERLMLLRDGQPFEGFVCRIADQPEIGVVAGDVILSNLPDRAPLRRIQRRFN